MKNYSDMSGYEVNNHLHNIIACDGQYDLKVEGYKVTWTHKETGRVTETTRKQYDKEFKDYLSSWADAGPVIQSNQISLDAIYEGGTRWLSFAGDDGEFRTVNGNPLRAAMIVFLMMQESK